MQHEGPVLVLEVEKGQTPRMTGRHHPSRKGFLYAKGKCDRTDCPYRHDIEAAPTETGSATAKASPKGKAKAAAAKAKAAAVVVEVKRDHNEDYLSDWSDNEGPSPVAASRVSVKRTKGHVRKDRVVKITAPRI